MKFVVAHEEDYAWMKDVIVRYELAAIGATILASPVHGELDPKRLVDCVLEDKLPVRVQIQIHKYIWSADATGV